MVLSENIKKGARNGSCRRNIWRNSWGVSRQAVSKWETGQSEPTAGRQRRNVAG